MVFLKKSASCPSGTRTAVNESEYSAGFLHNISKPQELTAIRVASANLLCLVKTFSKPSSVSMFIASSKPYNKLVAGVYGKYPFLLFSNIGSQSQ